MNRLNKIIIFGKLMAICVFVAIFILLQMIETSKADESTGNESVSPSITATSNRSIFYTTYATTLSQINQNSGSRENPNLNVPVNNINVVNSEFKMADPELYAPLIKKFDSAGIYGQGGVGAPFSLIDLTKVFSTFVVDKLGKNPSADAELDLLFNSIERGNAARRQVGHKQFILMYVDLLSAIDVFTNNTAREILMANISMGAQPKLELSREDIKRLRVSIGILKSYSELFKGATSEAVGVINKRLDDHFNLVNEHFLRYLDTNLVDRYPMHFLPYPLRNPYRYSVEDFRAVADKINQLVQTAEIVFNNLRLVPAINTTTVIRDEIKIRSKVYLITSISVAKVLSYLAIYNHNFSFLLSNDFLYQTIVNAPILTGIGIGLSAAALKAFIHMKRTRDQRMSDSYPTEQEGEKNTQLKGGSSVEQINDPRRTLHRMFTGGRCQSLFM